MLSLPILKRIDAYWWVTGSFYQLNLNVSLGKDHLYSSRDAHGTCWSFVNLQGNFTQKLSFHSSINSKYKALMIGFFLTDNMFRSLTLQVRWQGWIRRHNYKLNF